MASTQFFSQINITHLNYFLINNDRDIALLDSIKKFPALLHTFPTKKKQSAASAKQIFFHSQTHLTTVELIGKSFEKGDLIRHNLQKQV